MKSDVLEWKTQFLWFTSYLNNHHNLFIYVDSPQSPSLLLFLFLHQVIFLLIFLFLSLSLAKNILLRCKMGHTKTADCWMLAVLLKSSGTRLHLIEQYWQSNPCDLPSQLLQRLVLPHSAFLHLNSVFAYRNIYRKIVTERELLWS